MTELDNKIDEILLEVCKTGMCQIDDFPENREIFNVMLSRGILHNLGGGVLHTNDLSYKICKRGGWLKHLEIEEKIESEKEDKEKLEIELAKSNIKANKLNAKIAEQNKKDKRSNKIAMWINISIGIINLAAIIWQLLKAE